MGGTIEQYNDQSERAYYLEVMRTGHYTGERGAEPGGPVLDPDPLCDGGPAPAAAAGPGSGPGRVGGGGHTAPEPPDATDAAQRPTPVPPHGRGTPGGRRHRRDAGKRGLAPRLRQPIQLRHRWTG